MLLAVAVHPLKCPSARKFFATVLTVRALVLWRANQVRTEYLQSLRKFAWTAQLDSRVQKQRRNVKCGKPIFFLTFSFNSSLQNFPLIFFCSSSFFLSSSQHHTVARESSTPSPALRAPSAKLDSSKIKTPTPVSRANSVQLDGVPFLTKINNK